MHAELLGECCEVPEKEPNTRTVPCKMADCTSVSHFPYDAAVAVFRSRHSAGTQGRLLCPDLPGIITNAGASAGPPTTVFINSSWRGPTGTSAASSFALWAWIGAGYTFDIAPSRAETKQLNRISVAIRRSDQASSLTCKAVSLHRELGSRHTQTATAGCSQLQPPPPDSSAATVCSAGTCRQV